MAEAGRVFVVGVEGVGAVRSTRRFVAAVTAAGIVGALGAAVGSGPAAAADPAVLSPTAVVKDGPAAGYEQITSVDGVADDAALVEWGRSGEAVSWGTGGTSRRALDAGLDWSLTRGWVLGLDEDAAQVHVQHFDGSGDHVVALGAGAQFLASTADGWLEVGTSGDSATVVAFRVGIAVDGTVTRTSLGPVATAGDQQTIANVFVEMTKASRSLTTVGFSIDVTLTTTGGSGVEHVDPLVMYSAGNGSLTRLAANAPDTGLVAAVDGALLTIDWQESDPSIYQLTRRSPLTTAAWPVSTWPDTVVDLGGTVQWQETDPATGIAAFYQGGPDGARQAVASPWWAQRQVVTSGSTVVVHDGSAVVAYQPNGSAPVTLAAAHANPLSVPALAIDGVRLAWSDDSAPAVPGTSTVWTRTLGGADDASVLVQRATGLGSSVAFAAGQPFALQKATDDPDSVSLVRGNLGAAPTFVAPAEAASTLVGSSSVLLAQDVSWQKIGSDWRTVDALVDPATLAVSTVTDSMAIGDGWRATEVWQQVSGAPYLLSATDGTTTRSFTSRSWMSGVFITAGTLVWTTDEGATSTLHEANLAAGTEQTMAIPDGQTVVAAGSGRIALAPTQGSSSVDVYALGATAPGFRLVTGARPLDYYVPVVALGPTWAAWVTTGDTGDRVVAARIPGAPLFTDVDPGGNQFAPQIEWLVQQGITTGYADGGFHPVDPVSRQAMAAFLYRYAGSPAFTPPAVSPFNDVPTTSQFYKEITWLASTGITGGYSDGGFHPTAPVSRQAMAAFLYRFDQLPS